MRWNSLQWSQVSLGSASLSKSCEEYKENSAMEQVELVKLVSVLNLSSYKVVCGVIYAANFH